jgi:hypothetical protein
VVGGCQADNEVCHVDAHRPLDRKPEHRCTPFLIPVKARLDLKHARDHLGCQDFGRRPVPHDGPVIQHDKSWESAYRKAQIVDDGHHAYAVRRELL